MVRARIVVYSLSSLAVIAGLFHIFLYFFDLVPGQPTRGVVFFLRVGAALMVGIPVVLVQLVINTPHPQRVRRAEFIGLMVVLIVGIILSMLILPEMASRKLMGTRLEKAKARVVGSHPSH